eukprot:1161353-Pelagomonas_calceolata.AAC.6
MAFRGLALRRMAPLSTKQITRGASRDAAAAAAAAGHGAGRGAQAPRADAKKSDCAWVQQRALNLPLRDKWRPSASTHDAAWVLLLADKQPPEPER